jgi:hypothetical protein
MKMRQCCQDLVDTGLTPGQRDSSVAAMVVRPQVGRLPRILI